MKNSLLKYIFAAALFAGAFISGAADKLQAVITPDTIVEGENFTLQLSSNSGVPELQELPEGFTYQGNSQSTSIINGESSYRVGYTFVSPVPGSYKIKPLKVKLNKELLHTPELTLTVVKASDGMPEIDNVFARAALMDKRSTYYVGEDIPLTVNVYYPRQIRLQLSYPVLDIGKSVFRDFRKVNPENSAFAQPERSRKVIGEKLFEEISFITAFRPLAPGKLKVSGVVECNILVPEKRRSRDPFDSFFGGGTQYRRIARKLTLETADISIVPLPDVPGKGFFLNLIGSYNGKIALSGSQVNALEPFSLDVTLNTGANSSFETLRVPELTLPDCRVYPGEVRYTRSGCVISYAVIPLKAGLIDINQKFFTFDPDLNKYKEIEIDTALNVKPPVGKVLAPDNSKAVAGKDPAAAVLPEKSGSADEGPGLRTTLLYCKKAPEGAVKLFFRHNQQLIAWILFIAGPLFYLASGGIRKLFRHASDADSLRRGRAAAQRNALAEKVRSADDSVLAHLATGEVADFLSDRWKMPPGTTIEDIAKAAYDKELAEALQECANASYLPPELAKTAIKDPARIRAAILKALKCAVIVLAGWVCAVQADSTLADTVDNWDGALRAYDRGDYKKSRAYFEKYLNDNPLDANALYNLGCIAEASGDQETALWCMESAGLQSPLDSATFENRNVMRRKFFLPESGKAGTPGELFISLRDRLHPDDYLLIAAVCWVLFFILLTFRKAAGEKLFWSISGSLTVIAAAALVFMASQYTSAYKDDQALVVSKNAELYTFPGRHNGKKSGTLPGGTPVEIIEAQGEYSLIRGRNLEGWTENKNIRRLLTD